MSASIPIVILAGQSNALQSGLSTGVMGLAAAKNAIFLQLAVSGSPLDARLDKGTGDWSASGANGAGELLKGLIDQINAFTDPLSKNYVQGAYLSGVVWVQGEADAWSALAAKAYAGNLIALDNALTEKFGSHSFVVSQLSSSAASLMAASAQRVENWHTIQAGQVEFANANANHFLVNPDQLALSHNIKYSSMFSADGLHYDPNFGNILGARLAEEVFRQDPRLVNVEAVKIEAMIGTSGNESFKILGEGFQQVYGAGGIDTVRLNSLTFGVNINEIEGGSLQAQALNAATSFRLSMTSIEKIFLTGFDDAVILASRALRVSAGVGKDTIHGSSFDDRAWMDPGNDHFYGMGGNDKAYGGRGDDFLLGGMGHDTLYGGDGRDVLQGGAGNDFLFGGVGDDTLAGDLGNDNLHGGSGSNTFVFAIAHGKDNIDDFDPRNSQAGSHDRIDFSQLIGFQTFDAVKKSSFQQGEDVVIVTSLENYVRLSHVDMMSLDAGDFIF